MDHKMAFKVSAVYYVFVLLFVAACGAKVVVLDIAATGGLENRSLRFSEGDLPTTIRVNCTNADINTVYSMFYVSKEMYDDCTAPVAQGTNGRPPLNRIQCSASSETTLVDYSVTLRPPGIPNVVSFMLGGTYYFAFYQGGPYGSYDNGPCLNGFKFAIHIHDPSTVTTPTPTSAMVSPTSTIVASTTLIDTIRTTRVTSTSTTQELKPIDRTTSRTLDTTTTRTIVIPTVIVEPPSVNTDDLLTDPDIISVGVEGLTSGASPRAWTSLLLALLAAMAAVVVNYLS